MKSPLTAPTQTLEIAERIIEGKDRRAEALGIESYTDLDGFNEFRPRQHSLFDLIPETTTRHRLYSLGKNRFVITWEQWPEGLLTHFEWAKERGFEPSRKTLRSYNDYKTTFPPIRHFHIELTRPEAYAFLVVTRFEKEWWSDAGLKLEGGSTSNVRKAA